MKANPLYMGSLGAVVVEWYVFNNYKFIFENPLVMLVASIAYFFAAGFIATKIYDAAIMAGFLNTPLKRMGAIFGLIFVQFVVATIIRMSLS